MFDMPPDIPQQVIQQECHAVYAQYVHSASDVVRKDYEKMSSSSDDNKNPTEFLRMRDEAIKKNGEALGAQAGVTWRYAQIRKVLERPDIQHALDTAFDFSQVVTSHGVIYPVIEEASNALELSSDGQTARTSSLTWEIVKPARIVPTTPTWRDYLWMKALEKQGAPRPPSEGIMPVSSQESTKWLNAVCQGFADGVRQANLIFSDNMMQLMRDYKGMLRFRRLVQSNVVSEPEVVEGKLGVTMTESGRRVNVDDRMIRITAPAKFKQADDWQMIRVSPREDDKNILPGVQTIENEPEHIPVDVGIPK